MKKLLLPILSTVAIAPVITTVACNKAKTATLEFEQSVEECSNCPGFIVRNYNVEANSPYEFNMDFSQVPDETLKSNSKKMLFFNVCFSGPEDLPIEIDFNRVTVKLNDKKLEKGTGWEPGEVFVVHIKAPENGWDKTDKLVIDVAWKENKSNASVACFWDEWA